MAPKRRLPHTFPHRIIFVTSLLLCLCAGTTISFGVLAWSKRLWGYYWGTGFWSGGVILFAGIFGIVCSFVRNTCSVKTFMIISIFGCVVSLGMIALSAGGLDVNSGFFRGGNRTLFLTYVCHAVYLGIAVLQLALCVLSDGICVYYLFYEKSAELYRVSDGYKKKRKKKADVRSNGKSRSSSVSEAPLIKSSKSEKRKHKDKKNKPKSEQPSDAAEDMDLQSDMPVSYSSCSHPLSAKLLRKQEQATRSPCVRSASFSTFGHKDGPDRVSLIVHSPDDNLSVAGTTRTHSPDPQRDTECHYAQTLLFDPPLPIEEDDELPPYAAVDVHRGSNGQIRKQSRPTSEEIAKSAGQTTVKRSVSMPARRKSQTDNKRRRPSSSRLENILSENSLERKPAHSDSENAVLRHSRSADLLDAEAQMHSDAQGVVHKDFAHSSDRILVCQVKMRHGRPQSAKVVKERRLDRRRRALSAEVRLNKDQFVMPENTFQNKMGIRSRTNSLDGSNTSLFASNRILPTKFSLRTPVRQIGMPHVCSPVPVKPLQSSDLKLPPPPKPPRTHFVTIEDLQSDEMLYADTETVLAEIQQLTAGKDDAEDVAVTKDSEIKSVGVQLKANNENSDIVSAISDISKAKMAFSKNEKVCKSPEHKTETISHTTQVATIDTGPVLKCNPPKVNNKVDDATAKQVVESTMLIPTSPVLKKPPKTLHSPKEKIADGSLTKEHVKDKYSDSRPTSNKISNAHRTITSKQNGTNDDHNEKDVVYAKIDEQTKVSPGVEVKKSRKLLFSFSGKDEVSVFDPSPMEESSPVFKSTLEAEMADTITVKPKCESGTKSKPLTNPDDRVIELKEKKSLHQMSPLSPSEIILQRKNLNSSLCFGSESNNNSSQIKPVINCASDSHNGARPKTRLKSEPVPLPRTCSLGRYNQNGAGVAASVSPFVIPVTSGGSLPLSTASSKSNMFITSFKPPPPSRRHTSDSVCVGQPYSQGFQNKTFSARPPGTDSNTDNRLGNSSSIKPRETRASTRPVAGSSANSQGILHLPQSQHSRQMVGNIQGQGGLDQAVVANVQPAQGVNNDDSNKPLFSVIL